VPQENRPKIDVPGTLTASLGLFALVYGFSNSEMNSWGHPVTIFMLSAAVVLLTAFVFIESRVAHPLLPLRVITDRTRGGSYAVIGIAGVAMFAVFLFLTYYLQQNKGFTPIQTGLAFLPMPVAIVITATSVNIRFLAKVGPKPLLTLGTLLGAAAMAWFAQITPTSSYAGHILPGLVVMGVGMGNIFAPAIASATYGVDPKDSGVASAMVNTMQQVGGSIGTALLSSIFASSVAGYLEGKGQPSPQLIGEATVHGYTVAFWIASGIFLFGTLVVSVVMRSVRVAQPAGEPAGEPAMAH
jgi:predicted MFS family arabinose efflux permease